MFRHAQANSRSWFDKLTMSGEGASPLALSPSKGERSTYQHEKAPAGITSRGFYVHGVMGGS